MKFIVKGEEPSRLRKWREAQKSTPQNLRYINIPTDALKHLRDALIEEQGCLCAYTMMRISKMRGGHAGRARPAYEPRFEHNGHIEHIGAQHSNAELQVSYRNMVYCHPGEAAARCAFGAHAKDGEDVSPENFVSPLNETCETRFAFTKDGKVAAADPDDIAAERTIYILNLNCSELAKARTRAITLLAMFQKGRRAFSAGQAEKLLESFHVKDRQGRYPEFVIALTQVTEKYVKQKAAKEAAMAGR